MCFNIISTAAEQQGQNERNNQHKKERGVMYTLKHSITFSLAVKAVKY